MIVTVFDVEANFTFKSDVSRDIIEICAVPVNLYENIIYADNIFHGLVARPNGKDINKITKIKTGLTNYKQQNLEAFPDVFKRFMSYSRKSHYLCAWSESDFYLLLDHCLEYDLKLDWVTKYVDIQKPISQLLTGKDAISLDKAVEITGLYSLGNGHNAVLDTLHTAEILLKYADKIEFEPYIRSLFHNIRKKKSPVKLKPYKIQKKILSDLLFGERRF
jgi:inhibitor of KinA sporulation pathway (predicted exonuclease)